MKGIAIRSLTVGYDDAVVLSGVDLDIREGEIVCLIGASGCGKSTLLNAVAGLVPIRSGSIALDGVPISGPSADRVMVFQDDAVFPWMRVDENVGFGLKVKGVPAKERRRIVEEKLAAVELTHAAGFYPRELSGGMRKRVDLARALAVSPRVVLMDEPYGALDAMTKERLQLQFLKVCAETGSTSIFVTHDLEEALFLGNRVVVLARNPGRVRSVLDVPFGGDRSVELKRSPAFQALRGELANLIA
jgi:NitT/TauT family transport system ATP-binding protein